MAAPIHRKFREGVFTPAQYRHVLEPFALDSDENALRGNREYCRVAGRLEGG